MFETAGSHPSPSGATLLLRHQPAEGRPRAIILLLHGLAEHSARYAPLARELAAAGFQVYAHDHRGHGGTQVAGVAPRRFARQGGAEAVLQDCEAVEAVARAAHPGLPVVLLGHSMGGLIAANLAARDGGRLAGVAIWNANLSAGPAARLGLAALGVERALKGSDVSSAVFAQQTFEAWAKSVPNRRSDADWLTHDAAAAAAYAADPLCGWRPSVSMAADVLALAIQGGADATVRAFPRNLPVHLLGGGSDPATANGRAVLRFAERLRTAGCLRVTATIVADARHETLNEIARYREPAMEALRQFLSEAAPSR